MIRPPAPAKDHAMSPRTAFRSSLLALAAASLLAIAPARMAAAEALTINDETKAAIETIVRDYLLKNPEVMLEVQQALETKQEAEKKAAQKGLIAETKDAIFDSAHDGLVGNPDGKVTIVEFFDYNCGYCRKALSDIQALIKGGNAAALLGLTVL